MADVSGEARAAGVVIETTAARARVFRSFMRLVL
jgi:hypothetical protein